MAHNRRSSRTPKPRDYCVFELVPPTPFFGAPMLGYLVAPKDDPNRPLALVHTPSGVLGDGALKMAFRIADDPDGAWDELPRYSDRDDCYVIDFSGRRDDEAAPAFLYCASAWLVDSAGKREHRHPVELFPRWCPRRMITRSRALR